MADTRRVEMKTFDSRNGEDIRKLREMVEKDGSPMAHCALGQLLFGSDDAELIRESIPHLRIAADAGNDIAIGILGDAYLWGEGVERDVKRAMGYYMDSALMGNVDAIFTVGNEYLLGEVVAANYGKAFDFLSLGAEYGSERAMNSLALMYICGFHVEKDLKEAKRLLMKAYSRGNKHAKMNLDLIKENGPDFDYRVCLFETRRYLKKGTTREDSTGA